MYVRTKKRVCEEIGIECLGMELDEGISQDELALKVNEL